MNECKQAMYFNRKTIFLLFFLLTQTIIGFTQTRPLPTDSIFPNLTSGTVHIALKNFQKKDDQNQLNWIGPKIPSALKKDLNLKSDATHALGKISLDRNGKIKGYLVGCEKNKIELYIYTTNSSNHMIQLQVASYDYLETAYEETKNAWIVDLNKDGTMDIAIWKNLRDFEFPNELSDNISGDTRFTYLFKDNKYTYSYWLEEYLPDVRIL